MQLDLEMFIFWYIKAKQEEKNRFESFKGYVKHKII